MMNETLERYYLTLEKEERKRLLDDILSDDKVSEEIKAALAWLWSARYETKVRGRDMEDAFLNALTEMFYIDSQGKPLFFKGFGRRSLTGIAAAWGLDEYDGASPEVRVLMRQEYSNTVMFFADLGRDDKAYGRGIFNLVSVDGKKYMAKLRRDMERITGQLPVIYGMEKLFEPLREGAAAGADLYEKLYGEPRRNV